jgi:hypothetical protein
MIDLTEYRSYPWVSVLDNPSIQDRIANKVSNMAVGKLMGNDFAGLHVNFFVKNVEIIGGDGDTVKEYRIYQGHYPVIGAEGHFYHTSVILFEGKGGKWSRGNINIQSHREEDIPYNTEFEVLWEGGYPIIELGKLV